MNRAGKHDCGIDDMETLLDQLSEFESAILSRRNMNDPAIRQELQLFQKFIQWRIEDIHRANNSDWDREIIGLDNRRGQ